jgi:DNA-binding CsgD family transcriptional regulator
MACPSLSPPPVYAQPVDGVAAWCALLDGLWAIVDHIAGPHSYTLLCDAPPRGLRRPLLSQGELALLARRARGAAIKELAADTGYSIGHASALVTGAMRKLRVRGEAHLVALFDGQDGAPRLAAPLGLEGMVVEVNGARRLALTYPSPRWILPAVLSSTEAEIVLALLEGASHRQVARARGTAERTVANQVASIFRKLRVRSQLELFVALRPRTPPEGFRQLHWPLAGPDRHGRSPEQ